MRTVLLPGLPPPADPAGPSLLAATRERLPQGWRPVAAHRRVDAWRGLPVAAALAFLGADDARAAGSGSLADSLALTLAAQSRSRRVALLGVRAAPGRDRLSRVLARTLVARADLLVLADESSAEALVAAGAPAPLRVGTDPVWAAFASRPAATDRRDLAVAAVAGDGPRDELVKPLRRLAASGLALALQPWERRVGEATRRAGEIATELGGRAAVLDPVPDLDAARERFAAARLVVAGSPHALIAAAVAETPFVAAGDDRAARIARPLAQLAAGDGDLPGAVAGALETPPPSRSTVAAEIEAAEESFRLLRLLLSEGTEGGDEIGEGTRLAPEVWSA